MSFGGAVIIDVSDDDRVVLEGKLITTTTHWGFWKVYDYDKERIEEQYPDFFKWLHVYDSMLDKTCFWVSSYGKIRRLKEIKALLSAGSELFLTPSQAHVWTIFKNLKEPVE
jgi:hypothetical protein